MNVPPPGSVQTAPAPGKPEPGPAQRRPKVLLAPITVTPSKPLTPSHLKGLLWTDVMYRATSRLADTTYRYSHTTYDVTEQTLGFWEYLDRAGEAADYSAMTEEEIGELYVAYRKTAARPTPAALHPYSEAVERHGWRHPAGRRVLRLWESHYRALGLHDPGLLAHQPPGMGTEEMTERLAQLGMCLDQRHLGGSVHLDATRHGLPLRRIVTAAGRPNYLACALRELLPLAPDFDEVVLLFDSGLASDYQLLARVLERTGPTVRRVPVGRVPVGGRIASAREGGWQGTTAAALLRSATEEFGDEAIRLGMRLYFVAVLGPGDRESFRHDLLRQCLRRAERMLEHAREPDPAALAGTLLRYRRGHLYADPYRLTSSLLGRRTPPPAVDLLSAVFT
jgi:hypothetical protein